MNDIDTTELLNQTNMPHGFGYPGKRNLEFDAVFEDIDVYLANEYPVYLNIYDETRCYGGPEEGGWYYSRGVMLETPIKIFTPEEAVRIAHMKFEKFDGTTDGRLVLALSRTRGENYPTERPYYE